MSTTPFAVCVPARNESELLPRLLASLAVQTIGWDHGHIVLIANNCTDDTAAIAQRWSPQLPLIVCEIELPPSEAHAGSARKLALDTANDWLGSGRADGVLLTTDADAIVPSDWIECNLRALEHSDLVGGRLIAACDDSDARIERLQHLIELYWEGVRGLEEAIDPQAHDPAPRHGDHTGGSLAFRAKLYRELGGMPPLPTGEDVAFVERAVRSGARLRHCPEVTVRVSDRAIGRAAGGMAADMARRRAVVAGEGTYLLPHPSVWIERIEARRRLRQAWRAASDLPGALASEGLAVGAVSRVLQDCPNAIAFVERATQFLAMSHRAPIDVTVAVALLERLRTQVGKSQRVA